MHHKKSLLFDLDEILTRVEYEIEHGHLYMEDPPKWFSKFFRHSEMSIRSVYNMSRIVAEFTILRFEERLLQWIDARIDQKISSYIAEIHKGQNKK